MSTYGENKALIDKFCTTCIHYYNDNFDIGWCIGYKDYAENIRVDLCEIFIKKPWLIGGKLNGKD